MQQPRPSAQLLRRALAALLPPRRAENPEAFADHLKLQPPSPTFGTAWIGFVGACGSVLPPTDLSVVFWGFCLVNRIDNHLCSQSPCGVTPFLSLLSSEEIQITQSSAGAFRTGRAVGFSQWEKDVSSLW